MLQQTATHCNTLQHTATHCNTLQHTGCGVRWMRCAMGAQRIAQVNFAEVSSLQCSSSMHHGMHGAIAPIPQKSPQFLTRSSLPQQAAQLSLSEASSI